MKPAFFLIAALLISPAIARADLVYKCKSAKYSDEKTANLRFEESGRGGSVEVDHWRGYPPISLITAELRSPSQRDGKTIFESEVDPLWGYSAEVAVPNDFLRADFFETEITLIKAGNRRPILFHCNRF